MIQILKKGKKAKEQENCKSTMASNIPEWKEETIKIIN